jgi:hypothetical protein
MYSTTSGLSWSTRTAGTRYTASVSSPTRSDPRGKKLASGRARGWRRGCSTAAVIWGWASGSAYCPIAADALDAVDHLGAFENPGNRRCQRVVVERLGDTTQAAGVLGGPAIVLVGQRRQRQDRHAGRERIGFQTAGHFQTIDVRQANVEQDQVGLITGVFKRLRAAGGSGDGVAQHVVDDRADDIAIVRLIVDDEDAPPLGGSRQFTRRRGLGRRWRFI